MSNKIAIRAFQHLSFETLKNEVLQMQVVDFKKYADIIVNLQMNNEYYWLIKHFDDTTLEHIRNRFDKESGMDFMHRFNQLNDKVIRLKEKNIAPEDKQAQALAQEFWNMVMEFTNGDMSMLPTLMKFDNLIGDNNEWLKKQKQVNEYMMLKTLSIRELKYKLLEKGLDKKLVEKYIEDNREELEEYEKKCIEKIRRKKAGNMEEEKINQYLFRKGYPISKYE